MAWGAPRRTWLENELSLGKTPKVAEELFGCGELTLVFALLRALETTHRKNG